MQKKDVIYIDVEDDITAIIGKVKNADEKIVVLVPPKRTGVLQSAVNLKLLARAADESHKRLVLITHNSALGILAASAAIPVAKNLQSRPEIMKAAGANDDEEDIINGVDLSVGEHAGILASDDSATENTIESIDIDGESNAAKPKRAGVTGAAAPVKKKKGIKVPDFGTFRKKLIVGVGLGAILVLFLIWANVIAPHATIIVSAKTVGQSLQIPVTLGPNLVTNPDATTLKSIEQNEKINQTVDFEATGNKDVGNKATGTVTFSTNSIALLGKTVPTGTRLTASNGLVFITTESVTFTLGNYSGANADIVAANGGAQYNGITGSATGAPIGVDADITTTSGGTSKIVKVVQQLDVENAKSQLASQNKDDAKEKVRAKFKSSDIVIDSSLTTSGGDPVSLPAIGEETTDGKAKLTVEVTYTMSAVAKDEMESYLGDAFNQTLTNKDTQRVYDNGLKTVKFEDFKAGEKDKPDSAVLSAMAQIGPKIRDDDIKQQVKGKRAGEVIADIKGINGVSDVSIQLSPFWVSSVPDDVKKISIEFKIIKNG